MHVGGWRGCQVLSRIYWTAVGTTTNRVEVLVAVSTFPAVRHHGCSNTRDLAWGGLEGLQGHAGCYGLHLSCSCDPEERDVRLFGGGCDGSERKQAEWA